MFETDLTRSNLYRELRTRVWQARYARAKQFMTNVWTGVWLGSFVLFIVVYGAWEYSRRLVPVHV